MWFTSWGTTLWAPLPVYLLTSTACWTRLTTAIQALPALYRSPVTLQSWLTNITLLFKERQGCVYGNSMLCAYSVCVGIQLQEFSTRYVCMFSSCKGCCPWNRKLSTMGKHCDASPLYGERTVCADSNFTEGWSGTPALCTPILACFPFSRPRGFLAQLEWKYMEGKGVFSLILWGRGVLNAPTFIFFPKWCLV